MVRRRATDCIGTGARRFVHHFAGMVRALRTVPRDAELPSQQGSPVAALIAARHDTRSLGCCAAAYPATKPACRFGRFVRRGEGSAMARLVTLAPPLDRAHYAAGDPSSARL